MVTKTLIHLSVRMCVRVLQGHIDGSTTLHLNGMPPRSHPNGKGFSPFFFL